MRQNLFFSLLFLSVYSFKAFALEDQEDQQLIICSPTECYTIIQELGEGAFGKVYSVENSQGLPFAIKTYKEVKDTSNPLNYFTDAQREFSRGQLLYHPNIIRSHELFMSDSEEGIAHIVLDLVDGVPLYKAERGEIEASHLHETIMQFIDALRYAFAMDLMHLDLHTGNLMLDKGANIMVIDLASFFTLEEVQAYLFRKMSSSSAAEDKASIYPKTAMSAAVSALQSQEEPSIVPMAPLRAAKLEKFINDNPEILKETRTSFMEKDALVSMKTRKVTTFSKNASIIAGAKSLKKSKTFTSSASVDLTPFQAHYFDRITEICLSLISKSEGNRDEKIEMRASIKKIAWNYEEDRIEGIDLPFPTYLDQLFNSVQSR